MPVKGVFVKFKDYEKKKKKKIVTVYNLCRF